jgi:hypothetical protein
MSFVRRGEGEFLKDRENAPVSPVKSDFMNQHFPFPGFS